MNSSGDLVLFNGSASDCLKISTTDRSFFELAVDSHLQSIPCPIVFLCTSQLTYRFSLPSDIAMYDVQIVSVSSQDWLQFWNCPKMEMQASLCRNFAVCFACNGTFLCISVSCYHWLKTNTFTGSMTKGTKEHSLHAEVRKVGKIITNVLTSTFTWKPSDLAGN